MSDDELRKYLPSAETVARALDEEAAQDAARKVADNPALKESLGELQVPREPWVPFAFLDDPRFLPDAEPSERVEHVPPTELPRARVPHVTLTKIRVSPEIAARAAAGRVKAPAQGGPAMLDPRRIPTQPRLGTPGAPLPPAEQVLMPSTWSTKDDAKDDAPTDGADAAALEAAPVMERAAAHESAPAPVSVPVAAPRPAASPPTKGEPTSAAESTRPTTMSRTRIGMIGLVVAVALTGLVVLAKQETMSPTEPAAVVTAAAPAQDDPRRAAARAAPGEATANPRPSTTTDATGAAVSGSSPPPVRSATATAIPKPPQPPHPADAGVVDLEPTPTPVPPPVMTVDPEPSPPSPPASSEPVAPEVTPPPAPPPAPKPKPTPTASTPPPARTSKIPLLY